MQQPRAILLLLVLLSTAAGKSRGKEEKSGSSKSAEALEERKAKVPSESLWHQYLPEDSEGSMDDFAGDAFPGQSGPWLPHVENTSDPRSWRDAFMKVYADSYLHFAHASDDLPSGPEHASEARNLADLKRWKARQEAAIKGFVPKEFQEAAREDTEGRFEQREAEIEAERQAITKQASSPAAALPAFLMVAAGGRPMKAEVGSIERYVAQHLPYVSDPADPMAWKQAFMREYAESYMELLDDEESVARKHPDAPEHASDCRTASELRAWRHAQQARIKAFVPREFQKVAAADVERKFEKREAALAAEAAARRPRRQAQQGRQGAPAAGGEPSGEAAEPKGSVAGAEQEAQSPTLLAASPTMSHGPLLAAAGLLASVAAGALLARRRVQRDLDMGSYLLTTEA